MAITFHSHLLKYVFVILFILILGYAYFEARNVLYGPEIKLDFNNTLTVHDQKINIAGTVRNVAKLTIEGKEAMIDENNMFSRTILLTKGLNHLTLEAQDKFGKTKKQEINVIYTPKP